jgi:hypothetical protein
MFKPGLKRNYFVDVHVRKKRLGCWCVRQESRVGSECIVLGHVITLIREMYETGWYFNVRVELYDKSGYKQRRCLRLVHVCCIK